MRDPRIDEYARLLVERSVGVQPGWQVAIRATPLARPLIEAVIEQIARNGAYPILQLAFEPIGGPFAREAPLEVLARAAPLQRRIWDEVDGVISICGAGERARGRRPVRGAAGGRAAVAGAAARADDGDGGAVGDRASTRRRGRRRTRA